MKKVFLLIFLLVIKVSFSQSKKEQIVLLTNRVDSLNQVVNSQSKIINDKNSKISRLNTKITNLESSISSLNADISKLNLLLQGNKNEIATKSQQLTNLNLELQGNKNEIASKSQQLSNLQAQLKTKTDSLSIVLGELAKLKPALKTNVSTTSTNQVTQTGPFKSVKIGTQTWMTENLNVSTFRNGDPIPEAKTEEEWESAHINDQPAWCYYDNNPANGTKYGKLYNWHAVIDSRGLTPEGWHVPSDAEWTALESNLGDDAGNKMKSKSGWRNYKTGGSKACPNCASWNKEYRKKTPCHKCKDTRFAPAPEVTHSGNGTNSSGFSGLPGGFRDHDGHSLSIGDSGYWWSSTEDSTSLAWYRHLLYGTGSVYREYYSTMEGFSVRCLRD